MLFRSLVFACAFTVSVAWAQDVSRPEHLSAARLRDKVVSAALAENHTAAELLGSRGTYKYVIVRRDQTGEVEVHADWDDIFVVQEGVGSVLYGGKQTGGRDAGPEELGGGPGERRGGKITGGANRTLAPGDLMILPAGMPHQVRVEPGGSITYLVIKVAPQ